MRLYDMHDDVLTRKIVDLQDARELLLSRFSQLQVSCNHGGMRTWEDREIYCATAENASPVDIRGEIIFLEVCRCYFMTNVMKILLP